MRCHNGGWQPMVANVEMQQLIELVERAAPMATALERIETAIRIGAATSDAADDTVRHFVDEARREGHSWSEIGGRLGVSRQAARKRFAETGMVLDGVPDLPLRPRLLACLDVAGQEAESDGSPEPGSQHMLVGLLSEGYAANLMDRLGVTRERAKAEARRLFPAPTAPDHDDFLAAAARFARECGGDYVGTEHVLFVFAHDPGSRANRILEHLGVAAAVRRELRCFEPPHRSRWRRQRPRVGKFGTCCCSFCGRRQDEVQLVAGPGVWICRRCIDIAVDVLRTGSASQLR